MWWIRVKAVPGEGGRVIQRGMVVYSDSDGTLCWAYVLRIILMTLAGFLQREALIFS